MSWGATTVRSEEQGVDRGQGVASGRTIQAAKGDTIHRVSQQCEVATRRSPGVRRCALGSSTRRFTAGGYGSWCTFKEVWVPWEALHTAGTRSSSSREVIFFWPGARRAGTALAIGNDVAQWKRTGQKGLCAFASDAGGVRGQELLWHRKRRAQGAYRRRTRHIVLQLTRNNECWIILAGTVFQSAAGTCVLEGSSCVLSPRNCPFLVRRENGTASVT